jgi:hypothetical protein
MFHDSGKPAGRGAHRPGVNSADGMNGPEESGFGLSLNRHWAGMNESRLSIKTYRAGRSDCVPVGAISSENNSGGFP